MFLGLFTSKMKKKSSIKTIVTFWIIKLSRWLWTTISTSRTSHILALTLTWLLSSSKAFPNKFQDTTSRQPFKIYQDGKLWPCLIPWKELTLPEIVGLSSTAKSLWIKHSFKWTDSSSKTLLARSLKPLQKPKESKYWKTTPRLDYKPTSIPWVNWLANLTLKLVLKAMSFSTENMKPYSSFLTPWWSTSGKSITLTTIPAPSSKTRGFSPSKSDQFFWESKPTMNNFLILKLSSKRFSKTPRKRLKKLSKPPIIWSCLRMKCRNLSDKPRRQPKMKKDLFGSVNFVRKSLRLLNFWRNTWLLVMMRSN